MKFTIEPGTSADTDELEKLYDELNDYLAATTNYPGWIKGVYPVREDAVAGVNDETLYVARYDGRIVGSVILNHQPEKAYENVKWKIELDHSHIFVIHTFVVYPSFCKIRSRACINGLFIGIGSKLRGVKYCAVRCLREKYFRLFHCTKSSGFEYIDTVDLGWVITV